MSRHFFAKFASNPELRASAQLTLVHVLARPFRDMKRNSDDRFLRPQLGYASVTLFDPASVLPTKERQVRKIDRPAASTIVLIATCAPLQRSWGDPITAIHDLILAMSSKKRVTQRTRTRRVISITLQGEPCHRRCACWHVTWHPKGIESLLWTITKRSHVLALMLEHTGLVGSYLPGPCVGGVERFNHLPKRPCLIVMQQERA